MKGIEQSGHSWYLGKTEIFCKFNPRETEAAEAVKNWQKEQGDRAFKERYFANLIGPISPELSKAMCGFNNWWDKIKESIDPNKIVPRSGPLV